MKRREFMALAAAGVLVPAAANATIQYTPGLVQAELDAGNTLFLDWRADWCVTCNVQQRVITGLKAQNPAYDENIVFIDIDWDRFRRDRITKQYRIPRRSTLVAVKGEREIGRLIAQTRERQIKELMDAALEASLFA